MLGFAVLLALVTLAALPLEHPQPIAAPPDLATAHPGRRHASARVHITITAGADGADTSAVLASLSRRPAPPSRPARTRNAPTTRAPAPVPRRSAPQMPGRHRRRATSPGDQPCGVLDLEGCISGAVNQFLRTLVTDALNPMLALLSDTLLSTPNPSQLPRLVELWTGSWEILLAGYALLVAAAGILLMGYETVQSRYTLRELAPRIVLGFCAGALSLTGASAAIEATNAVTAAVLAGGVDETAGADALQRLITPAFAPGGDGGGGGLFALVLGVVMAAVLLALLLTFIVRVALMIVLVAGAPIALMFHALPHTDGIARWWWRTFTALLAIQLGQSLTLVAGLQVLLSPGGFGLFGLPNDDGFITLLVTLALLYILFKIPFWMLAASRIHHGRTLVGSLVRGFVAYKSFGLLTGRRRRRPGGADGGGGGDGGAVARAGPRGGPGPRPTPRTARPLPPGPVHRGRAADAAPRGRHPPPARPRSPTPRRPTRGPRQRGRQLALPLAEGDWPENRPVLGRDGQYRLPLRVTRRPTRPPVPAGATPTAARSRHRRRWPTARAAAQPLPEQPAAARRAVPAAAATGRPADPPPDPPPPPPLTTQRLRPTRSAAASAPPSAATAGRPRGGSCRCRRTGPDRPRHPGRPTPSPATSAGTPCPHRRFRHRHRHGRRQPANRGDTARRTAHPQRPYPARAPTQTRSAPIRRGRRRGRRRSAARTPGQRAPSGTSTRSTARRRRPVMTRPARIPSDIHRPDRVVGPFTARQAAILAATGAALYLLWTVARGLVAPPVFLAGAVPVAALALVVALGHRDGLSLDRLLLAAVRHRLTPRAPAPRPNPSDAPSAEGDSGVDQRPARPSPTNRRPRRAGGSHGFPARAVTPAHAPRGSGGVGVVDLGPDGLVVIAVVSTVNFALRTPAEQDGLVAGFARYLHTLAGPIQILIRALPVDLRSHLHQLHAHTRHLPHPALAAAAHDHLEHLARLAHRDGDQQLLTRQVLLVLREPHRGPVAGRDQPALAAGEHRLLRRLHDATTLLAPLDVTVTALDAAHTTALLTHICNPDHPGRAPGRPTPTPSSAAP